MKKKKFMWSCSSWNKEEKKMSEKKICRRGRRLDGLLPIFQSVSRYNGLYRDTRRARHDLQHGQCAFRHGQCALRHSLGHSRARPRYDAGAHHDTALCARVGHSGRSACARFVRATWAMGMCTMHSTQFLLSALF